MILENLKSRGKFFMFLIKWQRDYLVILVLTTLSIALISPPMFFHLIPRGEHHEESRGAKEELVMNSFLNSLMAPLIFNLVPRGEHREESRGYQEEPRQEFSFHLIPPMIFNLVPRGEHHKESRGAKEEPRHVFFFNSLMAPWFLTSFLVVSTTMNLVVTRRNLVSYFFSTPWLTPWFFTSFLATRNKTLSLSSESQSQNLFLTGWTHSS